MSNVWFITGTGRGMGVDIAKAALAAGHKVVATGRNTNAVSEAVGGAKDLMVAKLDITRPEDAEAAVTAAIERFGRIDVLVNNAANFYAGFFEEITPEDYRAQVETNLFGPMNVTRAVLPVMRAQRSGLVVTISSTAGVSGQAFVSAYAAAKFGVEGWMESLTPEVAPFGIRTMLVEPGFFRTELLTDESTKWPEPSIDDYVEKTKQTVTAWKGMNGLQGGDPVKLASLRVRTNPHCAGPPVLTPLEPSNKKRRTCSPRLTRIENCLRRLRTTARKVESRWLQRKLRLPR
jgi:NAD(P)-dependent dehydrogenase (short-subunit alcohol dehydrogenase family)